jgi:hypothetical protein
MLREEVKRNQMIEREGERERWKNRIYGLESKRQ